MTVKKGAGKLRIQGHFLGGAIALQNTLGEPRDQVFADYGATVAFLGSPIENLLLLVGGQLVFYFRLVAWRCLHPFKSCVRSDRRSTVTKETSKEEKRGKWVNACRGAYGALRKDKANLVSALCFQR